MRGNTSAALLLHATRLVACFPYGISGSIVEKVQVISSPLARPKKAKVDEINIPPEGQKPQLSVAFRALKSKPTTRTRKRTTGRVRGAAHSPKRDARTRDLKETPGGKKNSNRNNSNGKREHVSAASVKIRRSRPAHRRQPRQGEAKQGEAKAR